MQGHIWDNFSSDTYKDLPSVGVIRGLYNPVTPSDPISFELKGGGRGYYRTPTLVSVWATAPYFHNNSLGTYVKDPSVTGRMTAFSDGMEKLLWPEARLGVQSIMVTTTASRVTARDGSELDVPVGTPVKLIASVDPNQLVRLGQGGNWLTRLLGRIFEGKILWNGLIGINLAPDFIEDHGHTFGTDLPDEDKRALIEFIKTF